MWVPSRAATRRVAIPDAWAGLYGGSPDAPIVVMSDPESLRGRANE
jgi:hypothetical protein